jgi:hypothetical protein
MAPLAKNGGPQKKSWTAVAIAALFVMGFLAAVAFGDGGGGATTSGSTDTTTVSSSASTDTGTTDTTPTDTTSTDTSTTSTTTMSTTTTSPSIFSPTISSDQADYSPGSTVTLTGSGWSPGEGVHIFVNDNIGQTWSYSADVNADTSGAFTLQFQLPTTFIASYVATATGVISGTASTTFTDGNVTAYLSSTEGPTSITVNFLEFGSSSNQDNVCSTTGSASHSPQTVPSGGKQNLAGINNDQSLQLGAVTALPSGSYTFSGWTIGIAGGSSTDTGAPLSGNCISGNPSSGSNGNVANIFAHFLKNTAVSVASSLNPSTYGTSVTFTAAVTAPAGNPSGTGSVTFQDGGTNISGCGSQALSGNQATCATSSLSAGAHSITAIYNPGTGFAGSTSSALTQNVNTKSLTGSFTAQNKTYDRTTAATILTRSLSGVVGSDDVSLSGGTATFSDKNVGNGKTVTGTGFTLSGAASGNYTLGTVATTTANITALAITGSFTAQNKTYDRTTAATILTRSLSGVISGDTVTLVGGTPAVFSDKNVGLGKTVTGTGFSLSGGDATNYSLFASTLMTTANITALSITGGFTADNKVYDGNASATILTRSLIGVISGDGVSLIGGTATFADKNVGTGKTVTGTGFNLSGGDAGNYTLSSVGTTTANITALGITGSFTAASKTYDRTTAATVLTRSLNGAIGGDDVSLTGGTATFSDKNVGNGKTVTLSGATLDGTDAGNYTLSSVATTTANITALAITGSFSAGNKVYDGTTAATITSRNLSGVISGDTVSLTGGTATFADKNVGTGKTVTGAGFTLSGTDAGNYTLSSVGTATANITARPLTVSATGVNKQYDGGSSATVTLSTNKLGSDIVTAGYGSASFNNKNVGTGKPVSVSGISISGADATNYTLTNTTASTTADITARPLTVSAHGANKIYDGTTAATVTLSSDQLGGDLLTLSYSSASFADKNVGTGKTVNVSGISISGTDAGNYALQNTTASTSADITSADLHVSATGVNKQYDATTAATVTLSSDQVSTDTVNLAYSSASFADKNVGTGKAVSVTGISISGTDAGNYTLKNMTASTTADITARDLTVSATGVNKQYDGNASASVTLSTDKLGSDIVTASYGSASFNNKNVGSGKPVSVSGITISGGDATNYHLLNTTASTSADITARPLTVSATGVNKQYDSNPSATVTLTSDQLGGDLLTLNYSSASFADKNVGSGKLVSVNGITISGTDAGNYHLQNTTASTSADITARPLTVSATGVNKQYDGGSSATVTLSTNKLGSDIVTAGYGSASFNNKNVGTGKPVSVSGISISGADATNYTLTNTTASTTADITARPLTVSAHGANKIYDGTTAATVTLSSDQLGGDLLTLSYSSASFADKNVGTGKTVNVSGISISGTDAGNYALQNTTASTSADITSADLHVSATGVNKQYDATTAATVTLSSDQVSTDTVNLAYSSASFADKNVGTGKAVSVTGISISGTDAGNYTLKNMTASTTADITARDLTVSATGVNKQYDGNASASVTLSTDKLGSDIVTASYGSASFNNKNVGSGKPVSVSGITISGGDATNYHLLNTTASTSADITARPLTVSATGVNKQYDSNPSATVTLTSDQLGGDLLTLNYSSASFADKNVGSGKLVSVNGITISGTDAGNYHLQNTTASTSADITRATLDISAVTDSKTYDGTTNSDKTPAVSGLKSGDTVTGGTQAFGSKNVLGTDGSTLAVAGYTVNDGNSGNNYTVYTHTATGTITAKSLTVSFQANDKVFDGNTNATIKSSPAALVGVVSGDDVTIGTGSASASFDTNNVGSGKTVTGSGFTKSGGDAGNYVFASPQGTTTANITAWNAQGYGFYPPVGADATHSIFTAAPGSAPATKPTGMEWNTAKGGSTIPLKFNVYAGTVEKTSLSDTFAATPFQATRLNSCTDATLEDPVDFTTTGSTSLRYDTSALQWIQNWKTPTASSDTCYRAWVTFADGSSIEAFFKLKR